MQTMMTTRTSSRSFDVEDLDIEAPANPKVPLTTLTPGKPKSLPSWKPCRPPSDLDSVSNDAAHAFLHGRDCNCQHNTPAAVRTAFEKSC